MLCGEDATLRNRAYTNTPPYEWGPEVSFPPASLCGSSHTLGPLATVSDLPAFANHT